jgi:hypothetical protein
MHIKASAIAPAVRVAGCLAARAQATVTDTACIRDCLDLVGSRSHYAIAARFGGNRERLFYHKEHRGTE